LKWLAGTLLGVAMALPWGDRLAARVTMRLRPDAPKATERMSQEMRRLRRYSRICLAVLVASIPLGLFLPVFFLWWLPGRLGVFALMVLFQWLPHFPHKSTERFSNTRITTFRGSTWLLLQQDRHLIHHLYPSVPWYRYRAVFRELRPMLEAQGATIEGLDASPPRRIQWRAHAEPT
jgi:fatty acid desaturase